MSLGAGWRVGHGLVVAQAAAAVVGAQGVHVGQGVAHGGDAFDVPFVELFNVGEDLVEILAEACDFLIAELELSEFGDVGDVDLIVGHIAISVD